MKRDKIEGRAVAVRGDDIDTDRIIPARFLRCVVFDGLGAHVFEDDRLLEKELGREHPIDAPKAQGAEILLVNNNFGCGSSREHAPQAIMRWGIRAIVGESFAQIFFGNCSALGVPCLTVDNDTIEKLMALSESEPKTRFRIDLKTRMITAGKYSYSFEIDEGLRRQFLEGSWDTLTALQENHEEIEKTAAAVPYFTGWK